MGIYYVNDALDVNDYTFVDIESIVNIDESE